LALVALEAGLVLTADVGEAVLSSPSSLTLGAGAGVSTGALATTLVAAGAEVTALLVLHLCPWQFWLSASPLYDVGSLT
jgi:hypothetical protein